MTVATGVPLGAAVWVIADDVAVPALGLSQWPTEYPLSTNAYALTSHLIYDLTTDVVRRFDAQSTGISTELQFQVNSAVLDLERESAIRQAMSAYVAPISRDGRWPSDLMRAVVVGVLSVRSP